MSAILVVCHMVVLRYALKLSTTWQSDYIIYSLIAATLISSPYVLSQKGHIKMDFISQFMSLKGSLTLELGASVLGLIFTLILSYKGFALTTEAYRGSWTSDSVWELPLWIPYSALPLGLGVMALQYLADMAQLISRISKTRQ